MWDQVGQLYAYHGDGPARVRLLKLTEEVDEVSMGRSPEVFVRPVTMTEGRRLQRIGRTARDR
jgi:hypothetical protein